MTEVETPEIPAEKPQETPPEPELPPGRCMSCGADVPRADIEKFEDKPPLHRKKATRHDVIGELCGPVVTRWVFDVSYVGRAVVSLPVDMTHPAARQEVEKILRMGLHPEAAVLTSWQLLGTS